MTLKRVIISGGGTGGHIFPAIAIANQLKEEFPTIEILFIGAKGKMEMRKVPEAGYPIKGLWISGLQRKLTLKNFLLPFKLIDSLLKAKKIIKEFNPDVVIGVGGYASAPTLKMAIKLNIPTVIQEQNSFPGKTNKLLAKSVTKICGAYDNLDRFFPKEKIVITGNPVRKKVVQIEGKKAKARDHFKLNPNKKIIFVVGGSLGAKTLNDSMINNIEVFQENNVQLIWQCGSYQYDEMEEMMKSKNKEGIRLKEFIYEIELAYAAADVIISRAGAIAISELCIIGKPTVLVPSPNVAEDHQTKNAMALVNNNAALLVKDNEAREKLVPIIIQLLSDEAQQTELANNIKKKAIVDADKKIVDVIKEIAQ